jgi:hypothetical protein
MIKSAFLVICIASFGGSSEIVAHGTEPLVQRAEPHRDELLSQRFNHEFDLQRATIKELWNTLDATVLELLNAQYSVQQINSFFTGLRGFEGPRSDAKVIGKAIFFSAPQHETPTYILMPSRQNPMYLFGVFNYGYNGRGRLSVYTRRASGWIRTSRFDADSIVSFYELPASGSSFPLVIVQEFIGGDHDETEIEAWSLSEGKLVAGKLKTPHLMDADIEQTDGVVTGRFSEHPGLNESFLGQRIEYQLTIDEEFGRIRMNTVVLNPWLKVVSEFYDDLESKRVSKASQRLEKESLLQVLAFDSPRLSTNGGDLSSGTGFVVLEKYTPVDGRDEFLRVDVRRGPSGQWKIATVTKVKKP